VTALFIDASSTLFRRELWRIEMTGSQRTDPFTVEDFHHALKNWMLVPAPDPGSSPGRALILGARE